MTVLDVLSQVSLALPAIDNPLDGVTPTVEVFGVTFKGRLNIILGGLWGLVLVISAAAVIIAAGKWAWAAKVVHSSDSALEGAGQFRSALVAFGALAGMSTILGAILWIVQG